MINDCPKDVLLCFHLIWENFFFQIFQIFKSCFSFFPIKTCMHLLLWFVKIFPTKKKYCIFSISFIRLIIISGFEISKPKKWMELNEMKISTNILFFCQCLEWMKWKKLFFYLKSINYLLVTCEQMNLVVVAFFLLLVCSDMGYPFSFRLFFVSHENHVFLLEFLAVFFVSLFLWSNKQAVLIEMVVLKTKWSKHDGLFDLWFLLSLWTWNEMKECEWTFHSMFGRLWSFWWWWCIIVFVAVFTTK